jgi:hypothetical protein
MAIKDKAKTVRSEDRATREDDATYAGFGSGLDSGLDSIQQSSREIEARTDDLRRRALQGGRKVAEGVRSGSVKAYRVARARPRLVTGLAILGGVAIAAFLLRKRIPGAADKLVAAAAGMAIAAGAPEALDRLKTASRKAAGSPLVTRSLDMLHDAPSRLGKLSRDVARSHPVRQVGERIRRAM